MIPSCGAPCIYILQDFSVVIELIADNVDLEKKFVVQNGIELPIDVESSVKICGCICNILPDVIGAPKKSDPMSSFLEMDILFDKIKLELDISVVTILGTVMVVAVILLRFEIPVTAIYPVLILLLFTVLNMEIPDICKLVVEIFVDLTCVARRLVVVCVVFDNSGTVKLVLLCIFPVLRLLLFTVPNILILVIRRLDIVEEVAVN